MYKNLIEEAKSAGLEHIVIKVLIQKEGKQVLLVEDLKRPQSVYELPSASLKEEETIPQALQRAVTEMTSMQMKEVIAYLGHEDFEGARHYYFVVEVKDPYSVEENTKIAHAWLELQEAVGYPIRDQLREMLDRYAKLSG